MTSLSNMSKLLKATNAFKEEFTCLNCKQVYKKKWCAADDKPCYFCKNFLHMKENYTGILEDVDWCYLKSGETSRKEYYTDFLDNLSKWANHFQVFPTKQDLKTIEELRSVRDWTRNEPEYDCNY